MDTLNTPSREVLGSAMSSDNIRSRYARAYLERGCDLYEKGAVKMASIEFQRAARLGNPEAHVNLGHMFGSGELGVIDRRRMISLYKRAVALGIPQAAESLALTCKSRGNFRSYCYWMRKAAALSLDI